MEQLTWRRVATGWRLWTWLLGVSLLWVGYVERSLALRGLAAIVILVPFLPVGQGTRLYAKRVYKIRKDCLLAIKNSNSVYGKWVARHRRSLELLFIPASMEPLRQALLGSLVDPLRDGPAPKLVEMAVPRREAIERLAGELEARHPPGGEREFLDYAKKWWSASNQRLVERSKESERLLSAAMSQLEEVEPPRNLRSAHRSLESGLRAEYMTWATVHRALIGLDADAALAAHDELKAASAQIRAATTTIFSAASGTLRHRIM
jgi:hypothetical protein